MYIYLQHIFSFCDSAESKNKIHAFDTWLWNVRKVSQPLQNEIYSIVMFRNFIAKKGGNVMTKKPHLTFHRNTEWMKMAVTPHY